MRRRLMSGKVYGPTYAVTSRSSGSSSPSGASSSAIAVTLTGATYGDGMAGEWEPEAENWIRWARDPTDAYWDYSPGFFDGVLPPPGRRTLEVGCGEGRVARDLVTRGHDVVATDTAVSLVRAARAEDAASAYLGAGGAALPFRDATFDVVVAYN